MWCHAVLRWQVSEDAPYTNSEVVPNLCQAWCLHTIHHAGTKQHTIRLSLDSVFCTEREDSKREDVPITRNTHSLWKAPVRVVSLGAQLAVADGLEPDDKKSGRNPAPSGTRPSEKLKNMFRSLELFRTRLRPGSIFILDAMTRELKAGSAGLGPKPKHECDVSWCLRVLQVEVTAHARWLSAAVSREDGGRIAESQCLQSLMLS